MQSSNIRRNEQMEKQTLGMSSSLLGRENTSKNKIDKKMH